MQTVSTGIPGLDSILQGGVPQSAAVIVEGAPGTGKTTLGMQFLVHGTEVGEPGMYVTFEELPSQIHTEMGAFGWNLREMEKNNLLRVLCIAPDLLLEQMMEPGGVFERMVREIGCKRIVIDSISLYKYGTPLEQPVRATLYRLRSVLKRMSLTAVLLREETERGGEAVPYENFVFDGVIRLALKPYQDKYRIRTLEVLKMRGRPIIEGEHVYRFHEEGIHVIPARSMVEDIALLQHHQYIPTGLDKLDKLLGGGIATGTVIMLDTNSKANYKYILASILTNRIKAGDRIIAMFSSFNTPSDVQSVLAMHGVSLEETAESGGLYLLEHYRRSYPSRMKDNVFDISGLDNDKYREWLGARLGPIIRDGLNRGEKWFVYYDLNTIVAERGKPFVISYFAEEVAWARSMGITMMVLCNFTEVGEETSSYLERTSNGVIRTWVDGAYQYIQVVKSPNGVISEPLLIENIPDLPFIRIV